MLPFEEGMQLILETDLNPIYRHILENEHNNWIKIGYTYTLENTHILLFFIEQHRNILRCCVRCLIYKTKTYDIWYLRNNNDLKDLFKAYPVTIIDKLYINSTIYKINKR